MTKTNILKIFKISFGSTISFLISDYLGIMFSSSAAIITLLSIQDTKKETLKIFINRVISFITAIMVAFIVFELFGYNPISFGIFLLIFVYISYKFSLIDGISLNSVLISHFISTGCITGQSIINEFLLLIIGAGTAVILNLYIPTNVKEIKTMQENIEEKMRKILLIAALAITDNKNNTHNIDCFEELDNSLSIANDKAYANMNNTLLSYSRYYINYIDMRQNQMVILRNIYDLIFKLTCVPKQSHDISNILTSIGLSFNEKNNADYLLKELYEIKQNIKNDELPKTRLEFENRAILYTILNDIECFLLLKYEFVKDLSDKDFEEYRK